MFRQLLCLSNSSTRVVVITILYLDMVPKLVVIVLEWFKESDIPRYAPPYMVNILLDIILSNMGNSNK